MSNRNISSIKATMFDVPSNYKESLQYYTQSLQSKVNEVGQLSSDTYEIEQELVAGTLTFDKIICRVNHLLDPKTGANRGDDWKELKFFDFNTPRYLGQRYQFSDSVWITVNTDDYKSVTKSAVIRRCNNTLRWIDISTGKIITEPCIVDYNMKYVNLYYNDTVNIAQGSIRVICQNNEFSRQVALNDRFILGSRPYKVKSVADFLRNNTYDKDSVPLIDIDMYADAEAPDDDFELQIANMDRYKDVYPPILPTYFEIKITPSNTEILQSETVEYECYLYQSGYKTAYSLTFTASGVPDNYYHLEVIDGNHFSLTNIRRYNSPLIITCATDLYSQDINFILKGVY